MAKPFCCGRRMDGVYQGSAHVHQGWYSPVFVYWVDGQSFSPTEGYTYRERTLARRFAVGEAYPIWVNEKRPTFFVSQKKVRCPDVLLLLFGIGVLLLPFYV